MADQPNHVTLADAYTRIVMPQWMRLFTSATLRSGTTRLVARIANCHELHSRCEMPSHTGLIRYSITTISSSNRTETEAEDVLRRPIEDRVGREGSRVAIGQTRNGTVATFA